MYFRKSAPFFVISAVAVSCSVQKFSLVQERPSCRRALFKGLQAPAAFRMKELHEVFKMPALLCHAEHLSQGDCVQIDRAFRGATAQSIFSVLVNHRHGDLIETNAAQVRCPPRDCLLFAVLSSPLFFKNV